MVFNFTYVKLLLLSFLLPFLSPFIFKSNEAFGQISTGNATGVATFQCIGITWSGSGGNANTICNVKYRVAGSGLSWKDGYPLWFDSRAAGSGSSAARPANEYRGSLVNLTPGTNYEIQLSLQGSGIANTFTCTTWSENFPVSVTHAVTSSSSTLNITTSGTANGYALYTPVAGSDAIIDVNNASDNCVYINAAYIIVRGLTLKGAKADAIKLGPNAHDVVIERNDISGWGRIAGDGWGIDGDAGIRVSNQVSVERIIIQRNRIHHPRSNSNNWEQNRPLYNTNHPLGPQGITFETAGGNHVIRYNEIYSDLNHYFNDGIGGAENFSYEGFPRANSDIYGNKVSQTWDDGIESEGGNMNVRIWGNYLDSTFVKIAVAPVSVGPIYIFRNVANFSRRSAANDVNTVDGEDRGPFIKAGTSYSQYQGGQIFVFHNTILQPIVSGFNYSLGCGGGILDWGGGPMTPVESRNNIMQIHKSNWQSIGDDYSNQTKNSFNYDLYNGVITASGNQEANGIKGIPTYSSSNPPGVWALASTSKGFDAGTILNNFSDGYSGAGPDVGAYEAGVAPLEFGVDAYTSNQPPVANAGSNITITLPINSTILNGNGSDPDGTIASYSWSEVSGPVSYSLSNANTATTTLSNLVEGTYVFQLTVTDNNGKTASDNVVVVVNPAVVIANQPPIANAGNNITITLPVNNATLQGIGTDTDGSISSYKWEMINGPASYTIINANDATTDVNNLSAGTYIFRLTVTDNSGAIASDFMAVTVLTAPTSSNNQPPTANAGNSSILTLPNNSIVLQGSGSDLDGSIVSYKWAKIAGPNTYIIGNEISATTGLSNLVQGVYIFSLTVTDNNGATATAFVTVTVNAGMNLPPTANAGNDITITLPVNTTTLQGNGNDADGTIAAYKWAKISGPNTYTIANPNAAATGLSNLIQGVYVFSFIVTDNNGATAIAYKTITVNPAPPAPNQFPIANAGLNISITLPVNSAALNGSASKDPDGTIISYAWVKISGPSVYTVATPNTATSSLTNLVQGVYVFRLIVIDNSGATSSDEVAVTVIGPNHPPVAWAGNDIVIMLPITTTMLYGSKSSDPDGAIVTYEWQEVSGPTQATVSDTHAADLLVSELVIGEYIFKLTVTDNQGASSVVQIRVTVKNRNGEAIYCSLYPNPVSDLLNIMYIGNIRGEVRITIFDMNKRIVIEKLVTKNQLTLLTQIDVSRLSTGGYVMQASLPGSLKVSKKFVKDK